jgi:glycosyltransferase involved in cell wall biosynthesis
VSARIGWVASNTLDDVRGRHFALLPPVVRMRIANNARWLNANIPGVRNEMYRPRRRYDVVVFFKAMDGRCQAEAARIQANGGRVVFDANVNYYEIWGDYDIPGTRPTPEQQQDAIAMTKLADAVVADATALLPIVQRYTERAVVITDNVDLTRYSGPKEHVERARRRLVWSGVAPKAKPLLSIAGALSRLREVELVIVSNRRPEILDELSQAIPCRLVRFSEHRYPSVLRDCDVIVSPKRLVNAYEIGHTEYKITLGMAVGLPAVASPQQSYVEAIEHAGGGVLADTEEEWAEALSALLDDAGRRNEVGRRARRTVEERYSTPVVARRYAELLESLV